MTLVSNVLVFDIETVPDVEFGRRLHGLESLTDKQVGYVMQTRQRELTGSDFLSLEQQRIVAISIAMRTRDGFKVWSLGEPDSPEDELVRKGLLLTHEPNARMDIKKADMTDENKIIYQLRLVPGVGEIMAEAVAAEVKSFDEMEEQYRLFGKHALKDVTVPGVAGRKNRKVGKAISEKIYEYYNFDKHKDGVKMMHKKRKIVEDDDEEEEDEIED